MANLTIDELKKVLADKGVELPGGRLKKDDYVKLYEESMTLNSSIGDTYSSDEESSQSSRKVTSSTSPEKESRFLDVETLSDDALFQKLQEIGYNPGPVTQTTRNVYEKKLLHLLSGGANGFNTTRNENVDIDASEFSDGDVSIALPIRENLKRRSPKPSALARESSIIIKGTPPPETAPRRSVFIQRVSRDSSHRVIERIETSDFVPVREKSTERSYIGRWSPNISRFTTNIGKPKKESAGKSTLMYIVVLVFFFALCGAIYYQWNAIDPYQLIEEAAANEMKQIPKPQLEN